MSMGVLDYLLKPIDIRELDECLAHCRGTAQRTTGEKRTNMVSVMMNEEKCLFPCARTALTSSSI